MTQRSPPIRILFAAPRLTGQGTSGGESHTLHCLNHLARFAEVTVLTAQPPQGGAPTSGKSIRILSVADDTGFAEGRLRSALDCLRGGVWGYSRHYVRRYERALNREARRGAYDLLWGDGYDTAPYLRGLASIPSILMTRDSQSRFYQSLLQIRRDVATRLAEWRMTWFERRFYRHATRIVFLTEADRRWHERLDPQSVGVVAPMGVDLPPLETIHAAASDAERAGRPPTLLMTGAMDYGPNRDGAQWFVRRIFPQIRAQIPEAVFVIAGKAPTQDVQDLEQTPGVRVTGFVPDLQSEILKADLFVSPIRYGAGVKTKVLEAMALARPVVGTALSFEGIQSTGEKAWEKADDPQRFAERCVELLDDSTRRWELGRSARRRIEDFHTWDRHDQWLDQLIEAVAPAKPPHRIPDSESFHF